MAWLNRKGENQMNLDVPTHKPYRTSRLWMSLLGTTLTLLSICGLSAGTPTLNEIDLSSHITCPWDAYKPWNTWNGPPRGRQVLQGVPFRIDGVIQLKTVSPQASGEYHPTRVDGIKIGGRFTQLHLLHFTEMVSQHGAPLAKLILHYADGEERSFVLRYGLHLQDWNHPAYGTEAAESSSRYAWMAPQLNDPEDAFVTTCWETALLNPRPEVEVVSFDVRSLFSNSRYTLAAATAETGPDSPMPPRLVDSRPVPAAVEPLVQRVRFLDAGDGKPIALAVVQAWRRDGENLMQWAALDTDAQGEAALDFPRDAGDISVELRVVSPLHVPTRFSFVAKTSGTASSQPPALVFKVTRGGTIGGLVQDEQGRPVVGATVLLAGTEKDPLGKFILGKWPAAVTAADGRWSLNCAPPDLSGLTLTLQHSNFLATTYEQDDTGGGPITFRGQDLLLQKRVFKLRAGEETKGVVTAAGAPVAGASIMLFLGETSTAERRSAQTDSDGRFSIRGLETGPGRLLVTSEGFAPELLNIEIKTNVVAVALSRAKPLQALVRNPLGEAVKDVLFEVMTPGGGPFLPHIGYSDAEGKFRWDSAPAEGASFLIAKRGFHPLKGVVLRPGDVPHEMTINPDVFSAPEPVALPLVSGTVIERKATPLPLASFYNPIASRSWDVIPKGRQQLDGVTFQIDGHIELASSGTVSGRGAFPLEVAGIPVDKKFSRLHLLHCAEYSDKGKPLEDLVLHFANGERRVATLMYGVHATDWYDYAGDRYGLVQDPHSKIAWRGPSQDAAQYGKIVRLYHTTLVNPMPNQLVTRLDIISRLCGANPKIFAISTEEDASAKSEDSIFQPEEASQFDTIAVRTIDAETQQPISGARVRLTAMHGAAPVVIAESSTDPQGRQEFLCAHGAFHSFAATVTANGRRSSSATFAGSEIPNSPKEVTVKLSRGD
jgi:5-hydroxyisourate hydrolase-like protein (transthyretin family)